MTPKEMEDAERVLKEYREQRDAKLKKSAELNIKEAYRRAKSNIPDSILKKATCGQAGVTERCANCRIVPTVQCLALLVRQGYELKVEGTKIKGYKEDKSMDQTITVSNETSLSPVARAVQITERIRANGRIAANAVCEICKDLRTMKIDKLYTELGYQEFEEYAKKEFNLEKRQTILYISTYDKLGEEYMTANAQFGITKLAELATLNPEDRVEVVSNIDVENTTVKELKELTAKYKEQGEQLSMLEEDNRKLKEESELDRKEQENANAAAQKYKEECKFQAEERQRLEDRVKTLEQKIKEDAAKITNLEATVEDYESRPKDVEVAEKEIIKEVPNPETEKKLISTKNELLRANAEKIKKDNEIMKLKERMNEMERLRNKQKSEYESKIAELSKPAESSDKTSFKVTYTEVYKGVAGLIEIIKTSSDSEKDTFIERTRALITALSDKLKEVETNNE